MRAMDKELSWLQSELLGEDEVRRARAHALGVPFVVLERHDISSEALFLIPEPLARMHSVVAYARGEDGSVEVALLDLAALEALEFLRPLKVKPRFTTRSSLKQALFLYQKHLKEKFAGLLEHGTAAVDSLMRHALMSGASHVHLEPSLTGFLVRYRIQGLLTEAMRLSKAAGETLVVRLKELARLFPVETAAQEGGFKFEHEDGRVAVGVATAPTARGEKLTLRIAQEKRGQSGFTLSALGLHGRALERVHGVLHMRRGLLVTAGPAGAGKTTLLYTLLDALASPQYSIASIEDRIAVRLPGVFQTKTRPEIGFTTAAALRAALKTDPDIIMLDPLTPEAAPAAYAAARRGIFVLAAEGDPPAEADVRINLRLMHRLCPYCRARYKPARAELAFLEREGVRFSRVLAALKEEEGLGQDAQWKDVEFYRPDGCGKCERGFRGRVGVQEILPVQGPEDLALREDALFKAAAGLVALEEIISL